MRTREFIDLIKSEETLLKNAVIVAKEKKPLTKRMEELKEIFISLTDEDANTWLGFSLASMALDWVDWKRVILAFENEELDEE